MESNDGPSLHFTGFYGHPCASQRHLTWTLLRRCFDIAPLSPWLAIGDFNEILSHDDKIGGSTRNASQITAFRATLDACKLSQIPYEGERTTWTNKSQGNGNVKERLDYGFTNNHWDSTFLIPTLRHLDFYNSDHQALKVTICTSSDQINVPKFKSSSEEDYWHQRARISWMKSGDSNTKFFHQRANSRSTNNRIKKLRDANGNNQTKHHRYVGHYYHILSVSFQQPREEVRSLHAFMSDDKSPESMVCPLCSLPPSHIVGSLVTDAILDVLNNGADPTLLNKTIITLIPKVKKPQLITQYRPISLCTVLYKLISKSIVLRIQPFLPLVISEYQSAFLSQRLITDNVLVAFELLHSLKNRKRGTQGYAAIKLDMSKAFDRVEWPYLAQVMLKMGFGSVVIDLILRCLQSVTYSFLLNGQVLGELVPTRGIRQGDPLSPYLFLICAEGLSRLLQTSEQNGSLHGLKVSRTAPSVSHLFFADDSVLFVRANHQSARSIKHILDIYGRASGQVVNQDKCVLSFSPNTKSQNQDFFQHLLNMPIQPCHEEYLGLPSFAGRDKTKLFSSITDKIWKLLSSWKEQLFSVGGKEVLLKAVVQAIPTYAMSCFRLPVTLCNQIESMMSNFWWGSTSSGNAIHWKNWNSLCKAKVHGGLGFRNFILFNQALLAKQAWRLLESPNSLLGRVLHHRYFLNGNLLAAGLGATPSLTWRSIVWGKELLVQGLKWRVGTGENITCKSDSWLPGHTTFTPFSFKGPDASLQVADLIDQHRQWDITAISANFGPADFDRILAIPLSLFPAEDVLIWNGTTSGCYTVKSGYQFAVSLADSHETNTSTTLDSWWTKFWKLKLPSKIRIFVWKVFHNALPVASELHRKHIAETPFCPLCKVHKETLNHALFFCTRAKDVWRQSLLVFNFKMAASTTSADFLLYVSANTSSTEFEKFLVICWSIWFERNAEYHNKPSKKAAAVLDFATNYLLKYQNAQASSSHNAGSATSTASRASVTQETPLPSPTALWTAPPLGKLKLNSDAACNKALGKIGIGAVVRDSFGVIVAALSKPIQGCFKPEEMEAVALAHSLKWAANLGLSINFIETDSLLVVQDLKIAHMCNSAFHLILNDVNYLVSFFPRAQITHVKRSANTYADVLAKFALTVDTDVSWLEEFPPLLMTVM
uniref:Reverse transcriptase domain-containing protein n=1 Tax=Cannabis sativa TaxID=3483 RepID=A0A803QJN9_CANSA